MSIDTEPVAEQRQDLGWLGEHYELTLLFDSHEDSAAAQRTLEHVAARSIVFTEGHMLDQDYATQRLADLAAIAHLRLAVGQYDQETAPWMRYIAESFRSRETSDANRYDLHNYALYAGLLAKNCIILPADFLNLEGEANPRALPEQRQQPVNANTDLRQAVWRAGQHIEWQAALLKFYDRREEAAVGWVGDFLADFLRRGNFKGVATTQVGRYKIALVFGSGHARTLTAKFVEAGLPVRSLLIDPDNLGAREDLEHWQTAGRKLLRRELTVEYLKDLGAVDLAEAVRSKLPAKMTNPARQG